MHVRSDVPPAAGPARPRRRRTRTSGARLWLLAGIAFVAVPACGGGGGLGDDGVHTAGVHAALAFASASAHADPACGGGGATGDN